MTPPDYDAGGTLPPALTTVTNRTGRPIPVLAAPERPPMPKNPPAPADAAPAAHVVAAEALTAYRRALAEAGDIHDVDARTGRITQIGDGLHQLALSLATNHFDPLPADDNR